LSSEEDEEHHKNDCVCVSPLRTTEKHWTVWGYQERNKKTRLLKYNSLSILMDASSIGKYISGAPNQTLHAPIGRIQKLSALILFTPKMDENKRRIDALLNIIQTSRGNYERLLELVDQLSVLLLRVVDEEKRKQLEEDLSSNTIEPPAGEPPYLEIDENSKGLVKVDIPSSQLHEIFLDSDGIIDFMNR
jgi:hypothetical protein